MTAKLPIGNQVHNFTPWDYDIGDQVKIITDQTVISMLFYTPKDEPKLYRQRFGRLAQIEIDGRKTVWSFGQASYKVGDKVEIEVGECELSPVLAQHGRIIEIIHYPANNPFTD